MRKPRHFGLATIGLLAAMILSGCGGGAPAAPSQPAAPAPPPAPSQPAAPAPPPAPSQPAAPAPAARWAMATSSSGSSPFVVGGIISDVANRGTTAFEVTPQVTGGFKENVGLIDKGEMQLGQVTLGQANGAAKTNLRALFNIQLSSVHVIVTDPKLKSIDNLKGKKVNMGAPGQITHTLATALLKTYGLGDKDYNVGELNTGEAINALRDGQTDAVFVIATLPMPSLSELAATKPFQLLPIDTDKIDTYIAAIGHTGIPDTIPAGTYSGLASPVSTVAIVTTLVANQSLDDNTVYDFTRAVWDHLADLQEAHVSFKSMTIKQAIQGISLPLHPGAERYFKEKGLL